MVDYAKVLLVLTLAILINRDYNLNHHAKIKSKINQNRYIPCQELFLFRLFELIFLETENAQLIRTPDSNVVCITLEAGNITCTAAASAAPKG